MVKKVIKKKKKVAKKAPTKKNSQTLGMKLKYYRKKKKNLTQEKAATIVGCSLKTWYRWESGQSIPMTHYLKELSKLFPLLKGI